MATIDTDSPTWRAVKAWAEERLAFRRQLLEATGTPIDETENHRGAVEELNSLLAQGDVGPDLSGIDG